MAGDTSRTIYNQNSSGLTEWPEELRGMPHLREISMFRNALTDVPSWIGIFKELEILTINANQIRELPDEVAELENLRELHLGRGLGGNPLGHVPEVLRELRNLTTLALNDCELTDVPAWVFELPKLQSLYLHNNEITELPRTAGSTSLNLLQLSKNQLDSMDRVVADHPDLAQLRLSGNRIAEVPRGVSRMRHLRELFLDGNRLESVPAALFELPGLETLTLAENKLRVFPRECLAMADRLLASGAGRDEFRVRGRIDLSANEIGSLPQEIGAKDYLGVLRIEDNPLAPEILGALASGYDVLQEYLEFLHRDGVLVRQAKLVLVGEGAVGKSSLLDAMCGEPWVPDRETTHGIRRKQVHVEGPAGQKIQMNGWDFGGQPVYRPTHQLFFSAPAVYLVVWKPREGPEQGFVDYWIKLIRHRAGEDVRIIVVSTHGGPKQRSSLLDEARLREEHGETVVGFTSVDSQTGQGIDELRAMIAGTALTIPHLERVYPQTWLEARAALERLDRPFLHHYEYFSWMQDNQIDKNQALTLAKISHALGQWIYYEDEPGLNDLFILQPDWLSKAISFVLDDPVTIRNNGILPHDHLPAIWEGADRAPDERYDRSVQQLLLRLMERFEISYRVESPLGGEASLVTQLVRAGRPDLGAWEEDHSYAIELTQVCEVIEARHGSPGNAEGLVYQLIAKFHRFSLGRHDYEQAVHWQSGLLLRDSYNGTALILTERNQIRVTVRAAYPQFFLGRLVQEIKDHVEAFWKGLNVRVMVPCADPCGRSQPSLGLFEVDKLLGSRAKGRTEFPCSVAACESWQSIDALLSGVTIPPRDDAGMEMLIRRAVAPEIQRAVATTQELWHVTERGFHALEFEMQRALSQTDERLSQILTALDDEAKDGPRLFSFVRSRRTLLKPAMIFRHYRLVLWCEHSRVPLPLLDPAAKEYELRLPMAWFETAMPFIRATALLLNSVLPVSLATLKLDLSDAEWTAVEERVEVFKEGLDLAARAASTWPSSTDNTARELLAADAISAEGAMLRTLHSTLATVDPTFGDLRRVRDSRGRYLWVHEKFVPLYQPPLPRIP